MHNDKILFRDTKWLPSNMSYRGSWRWSSLSLRSRPYNMAAPLSTCTMEEQRSVIQFCGQRVWNLLKYTEEWRFSMAPSDFHLFGPMKEHLRGQKFCRWWGNGGGAKLVKGHAKKLFSRGHPQACGQVDQVCCEAGGLCRKIRHKQFL